MGARRIVKSSFLVSSLISVAVAVLAIGITVVRRARQSEAPTFANTDQFIQYMAAQAVSDARQQDHVNLDYSVESIKTVDQVLGRLHDQYAKDPSSVSATGLGSAYGAYVGEVIRRSERGAKWERDDPVAGEKSYPLIWAAGRSFPMTWCYHRIVNGAEDDIWFKYAVLKNKAKDTQPQSAK